MPHWSRPSLELPADVRFPLPADRVHSGSAISRGGLDCSSGLMPPRSGLQRRQLSIVVTQSPAYHGGEANVMTMSQCVPVTTMLLHHVHDDTMLHCDDDNVVTASWCRHCHAMPAARHSNVHMAWRLRRSLTHSIKVWLCIIHVNFNFPFKLGPKVSPRIIHKYVLYMRFYGSRKSRVSYQMAPVSISLRTLKEIWHLLTTMCVYDS